MGLRLLVFLLLLGWGSAVLAQRGSFMSVQEFREMAFGAPAPAWQTLWVGKRERARIESILGHSFPALRVRYLGVGSRTAWVFEEIGKELPITLGVVVDNGSVQSTVVLEYRESRGGEIRHPFFSRQFLGARLKADEQLELDREIDGITGATLSVRAMQNVVRLALYCHQLTPFS